MQNSGKAQMLEIMKELGLIVAKKTQTKYPQFPQTIFVENIGDDVGQLEDLILRFAAEDSLAEDEIELAVYEFKKVVKVTRESKIVVTDVK